MTRLKQRESLPGATNKSLSAWKKQQYHNIKPLFHSKVNIVDSVL